MTSHDDNVVLAFGSSGRHKPDALKQKQGTYRTDRAAPEADYKDVEKAIEPVPPDWMVDPKAQDFYCQSFRLLRDAGILTFADIAIIEVYAAERARIQRMYESMYQLVEDKDSGETVMKFIATAGPGTEKLNAFRMLSGELGFSPVSRHKAAKTGKPVGGKKNDWEKF